VDAGLRSNVPDAQRGVARARDEHVERRMQCDAVDARQMAVVGAHRSVDFEIPAFHHLVVADREEIRQAAADGDAANRTNVAGQRELQFARRQVPDLDGAIGGTGREPLVTRIDGDAAHPARVARHDAHQLPRRVELGLLGFHFRVQREREAVVLRRAAVGAAGARGATWHEKADLVRRRRRAARRTAGRRRDNERARAAAEAAGLLRQRVDDALELVGHHCVALVGIFDRRAAAAAAAADAAATGRVAVERDSCRRCRRRASAVGARRGRRVYCFALVGQIVVLVGDQRRHSQPMHVVGQIEFVAKVCSKEFVCAFQRFYLLQLDTLSHRSTKKKVTRFVSLGMTTAATSATSAVLNAPLSPRTKKLSDDRIFDYFLRVELKPDPSTAACVAFRSRSCSMCGFVGLLAFGFRFAHCRHGLLSLAISFVMVSHTRHLSIR
jgi:hypothetical protein